MPNARGAHAGSRRGAWGCVTDDSSRCRILVEADWLRDPATGNEFGQRVRIGYAVNPRLWEVEKNEPTGGGIATRLGDPATGASSRSVALCQQSR
jgi:hypothetical protein